MHVYYSFFLYLLLHVAFLPCIFCVAHHFYFLFSSEIFLSARIIPPVLPRFLLYSLVLIFLTSPSRIHLAINESYFVLCPGYLFMFSSVFLVYFCKCQIPYYFFRSGWWRFVLLALVLSSPSLSSRDGIISLEENLLAFVSELSEPPFFVSRTVLQAHDRHSPCHIKLHQVQHDSPSPRISHVHE